MWRVEEQMAPGPSSSDPVTHAGPFQGMADLRMQRLLYLEVSSGLPCQCLAPEPQMQSRNEDKPISKDTARPVLVRLPLPTPTLSPHGLEVQALLRACVRVCVTLHTLPGT